ncbi:MAG TPA: glycosyltransferase family 39 protein, partial [Candidatus Limnocylindrales bacterium]
MTDPAPRAAPARIGRVAALALGLAGAILALAVVRIAVGGWAPVAADDARYVFVGESVIDGDGPLTPSGTVFLLRSPVYGVALAAGGRIGGGDVLSGARLVALVLSIAALLGAVAYGWLLRGPTAAIATAVALAAIPLVWSLVPTLRIDLPQTAGVVATLLALHRPTTRRWALAGALLGLTVLVKETAALLALLPIAWLGVLSRGRLLRLWAVYLGVAVAVAAWWWIAVWWQSGQLFPLNALAVIEARDVGGAIHVDRYAALLLALAVGAWATVALAAGRDPALRPLLVAGACLLPPAAYAIANGLNARNEVGPAVLSAIAAGVAAAILLGRVPRHRRALARGAIAAGALAVGTLALVAVGQLRVETPRDTGLAAEVAGWLREHAPAGASASMTFFDNDAVAIHLDGEVELPNLPPARVEAGDDPGDYVWMGLRDRQLFGYRRQDWIAALSGPGSFGLVLAGPHPLTPAELLDDLDAGRV